MKSGRCFFGIIKYVNKFLQQNGDAIINMGMTGVEAIDSKVKGGTVTPLKPNGIGIMDGLLPGGGAGGPGSTGSLRYT